jgi:hypothetical protein
MAVLASRRKLVVSREGVPMERTVVLRLLVRVAGTTFHRLDRGLVRQLCAHEIGVAVGAVQGSVDAGRKVLRERRVFVAKEAVLGRLRMQRGRPGDQQGHQAPREGA